MPTHPAEWTEFLRDCSWSPYNPIAGAEQTVGNSNPVCHAHQPNQHWIQIQLWLFTNFQMRIVTSTESASLKGHSLFSDPTAPALKYDHIFTPREENDSINLDVTFL